MLKSVHHLPSLKQRRDITEHSVDVSSVGTRMQSDLLPNVYQTVKPKPPGEKLSNFFQHKGAAGQSNDRVINAKLNTYARVVNNYDIRKQLDKELKFAPISQ